MLSALKRSGKSLDECCGELTLYPQTPDQREGRARLRLDQERRDGGREREAVERELGDAGRVLIRASGTEPLIRVMVEAKTHDLAESMARRIADKVAA